MDRSKSSKVTNGKFQKRDYDAALLRKDLYLAKVTSYIIDPLLLVILVH